MGDRPVVLVTGASRGIGAAVALVAAADHDVVVNFASDSSSAERVADSVRAAGAEALVVRADVSDEAAVVAMFEAVDRHFGRLDVLVNNAGIAGSYGTVDTVTAEMLQHLWAVNITGAFVCAREAVARMRTDRGGRGGSIVNISSKAAVLGGSGEWVHYAASKGALDTMTAGLSKELAPLGIRVNTVRPGLVDSDFHLHAPEGRLARIEPTIPLQRAGTPEEIAAAVMFLAGPASGYTTGAFVDVAGGR